jgi:energy-coupling factor transport system permease protein
MTPIVAPVARVNAPLARRNPVAKLGAALIFTLPLVSTVDPLTPTLGLLVEAALLPLFGVRAGVLLRRAWPLALGAGGILITMVLFAAERTGALLFSLGPVDVTSGVLLGALGLVLRVFALALPGIIIFATTDPTDLADALVQNARMPARFAIGALAAFRMIPLLGQEWQMLTLARRARGIDAGRNPVAKLKLFSATAFALLVGALRRGGRLAVAMDARGFDSEVPRTIARRQHFTPADAALLAGAALLSGLALTASIVTGLFHPIIG